MRVALTFFALLTFVSCHDPERPDGEVRPVTARDLVRQYRDDPGAARIAFTGQRVRVLVSAADVVEVEVHWRLTYQDPPVPPALVFRFASRPEFRAPGWIEGDCRGRVDDEHDRGGVGYRFSVTVTDCRVVPDPTPESP